MLRDREAQFNMLEGELVRIEDEAHTYKCRNMLINELLLQS